MFRHTLQALNLVLLVFFSVREDAFAEAAPPQTNIQRSAKVTCSVMAGERKPDGQSTQLLLMLNDDDPISEAFTREVIRQCPKTYLNFNQRTRTNNPYPPGSLLKQDSVPLLRNPD